MNAPALLIQAIVIAISIFVGLGLIRWGMDLLKERFGGRQAKQRDENVANQRLASGKKMYGSINSAPTGSDLTSDSNIDRLIRDGNLEEAFNTARDLRSIAAEMNNHNIVELYSSYESRINKLIDKKAQAERQKNW